MKCVAGLVVCSMLLAGCNVAGVVERITSPDEVVEARFKPANVGTVVFLDDRRNQINPVRLRREIVDEVTHVLIDEGHMDHMISPRDAMAAARRLDTASSTAGIDAVGRAVGADQVIYIEAVGFRISRNGLAPDPAAAFNIRVIDLNTQERVFPADDAGRGGYPMQVTLSREKLAELSGGADAARLRGALAKRAGDQIARLFVDTAYAANGERLIDIEEGQ